MNKIYQEDLELIFDCLNESMKKKVSVKDVITRKGYLIINKENQTTEDVINMKAFMPRYISLLRKEKKDEKSLVQTKKMLNDFISKYKMRRI